MEPSGLPSNPSLTKGIRMKKYFWIATALLAVSYAPVVNASVDYTCGVDRGLDVLWSEAFKGYQASQSADRVICSTAADGSAGANCQSLNYYVESATYKDGKMACKIRYEPSTHDEPFHMIWKTKAECKVSLKNEANCTDTNGNTFKVSCKDEHRGLNLPGPDQFTREGAAKAALFKLAGLKVINKDTLSCQYTMKPFVVTFTKKAAPGSSCEVTSNRNFDCMVNTPTTVK